MDDINYYIEEHDMSNFPKKSFKGSYKSVNRKTDFTEDDFIIFKKTGLFVSFDSNSYNEIAKWNNFIQLFSSSQVKKINKYIFLGFNFDEKLEIIPYYPNYCRTIRIYVSYSCPLWILNQLFKSRLIGLQQVILFPKYKNISKQVLNLINN